MNLSATALGRDDDPPEGGVPGVPNTIVPGSTEARPDRPVEPTGRERAPEFPIVVWRPQPLLERHVQGLLDATSQEGGHALGQIGEGSCHTEDGKVYGLSFFAEADGASRIEPAYLELSLSVTERDADRNAFDFDMMKRLLANMFDCEVEAKHNRIVIKDFPRRPGIHVVIDCPKMLEDSSHFSIHLRDAAESGKDIGCKLRDVSAEGIMRSYGQIWDMGLRMLEVIIKYSGRRLEGGLVQMHKFVTLNEVGEAIGIMDRIIRTNPRRAQGSFFRNEEGELIVIIREGDQLKIYKPEELMQESVKDTGKKGLDSIYGQPAAVAKFKRVVSAMKNREKYMALNAMPNLAALLHGPGGVGKTSIAKALAQELGAQFFLLDSSVTHTSFIGLAGEGITKRLDEVLAYADANPDKLAVLLVDEIDAIAPSIEEARSAAGASASRATEQTTAFKDKLERLVEHGRIFVVAASNFPSSVDQQVRERLGDEIEMVLPDIATAEKFCSDLLQTKLNGIEPEDKPTFEVDIPLIAQALVAQGLAQRGIKKVVNEVWSIAATRHVEGGEAFVVRTADFTGAIPGIARKERDAEREKTRRGIGFKTARVLGEE